MVINLKKKDAEAVKVIHGEQFLEKNRSLAPSYKRTVLI